MRSKIEIRALERRPGEKQKRKKSVFSNWLLKVLKKEPDKRKKIRISIYNLLVRDLDTPLPCLFVHALFNSTLSFSA